MRQAGDVAMHTTLSRRRLLNGSAAIVGAAWSDLAPAANDYPSLPIRLIVSSAAGSSPEVIARLVAGEMSLHLRQPVVVDNRVGASLIIGTDALAKAIPDGYEVGYVTPTITLNQALQFRAPFDAQRDLQPVFPRRSEWFVDLWHNGFDRVLRARMKCITSRSQFTE